MAVRYRLVKLKAFNKGFAKTNQNQWIWISPEELETKKAEAISINLPVPNCQRFCYNNQFRVMFFHRHTEWGFVEHLMITQHNAKKINNHWATLQQIKNELMGSDRLAIEVYPPVSELVDHINAYHLWILPVGFKLPFGLNPGWSN